MASDDKLKRTIKIENMEMRQSPPKAIVDCSPLQPAISKNKEALKIKLMVRRPIAQLVDQGIIPSLKSSPALHEQRKQLERAKTGDILKAKIQQRPARQELEQRHILEHDEGHVDPSLAERQRMLKKARLADQLNSQLSHRPGPLELIKKNILHTEEPIERIVKEGLISFKATSEGLLNRPQQPNGYITFEDDSQSSEGDQQNSPAGQDSNEAIATTSTAIIPLTTNENNNNSISSSSSSSNSSNNNNTLISVVTQPKLPPTYYAPIESSVASPLAKPTAETFQVKPETSNLFAELCQSVIDNTSSLNYGGQQKSGQRNVVTSLPSLTASGLQAFPTPVQNFNKCDAPGKDKNRKKNKLKPITKTRTIKFHEYKGPPNAQKNGGSALSTEETSYQLLLKQQNCLLEYLEGLHKNIPTTAAAAAAAASAKSAAPTETQTFSMTNNFMQQSSPIVSSSGSVKQPSSPASNSGTAISAITTTTNNSSSSSSNSDTNNLELSKLEKMKVSDLKLLLKTRNLPVSGPKPQLIERLRPFVQQQQQQQQQNDASETMTSDNGTIDDDDSEIASRISPVQMETDAIELHDVSKPKSNAELLREQQRKIDELQRKLKESQQELQQMQMKQCQPSTAVIVTTQTSSDVVPNKPELLNQKQIFKQQLEAKIQKDKLQKLENLQKLQMEQQQQQQQQQLKQQEMQRKKQENAVKINQEAITSKPVISTNFIGQTAKNPNEFVWNGESTILLVNFPDDKKYVLSSNPQATTQMQNFLVPISTNSSNINAIVKKINLNTQIQQQPPPPPPPPVPVSLHLTQITAPKISSHPMNVNANKSINVNKLQNMLGQQHHHQQQQQHQTLPSINGAITVVNSARNRSLHNPSDNSVMLNNVSTTLPFNVQPPSASIKKEYSLFDASASATDSTMIPNDLLLSANAMDTMSPMQQSNCDDSCNSFDLFLSEAAQSHSDAAKMHDQQHNKVNAMNVKKEPPSSQSMVPSMSSVSSVDPCNVDLKTFDDLELMELMSQQLDMDISDDSCHQPMTGIKDELIDRVGGSGGMNHSQSSNMIASCRREMNPSLQPSLSELIQQQQQQHQQHHHQQQQQSDQNQHQIRPQQQTLNSHISNHRSSNNSDTNNNLSSSLDSNPNNNLIDYNNPFYLGNQLNPMSSSASNGLHLGSMDIEYFDNTLAQFDFALPSVNTPLSTPINQTSSSMNFDSSGGSGGCSTSDQQLMNALNTSNSLMTSSSAYYPNTSSTMNNHVLDLFNIDDFKMSGDSLPWSEVDYAV